MSSYLSTDSVSRSQLLRHYSTSGSREGTGASVGLGVLALLTSLALGWWYRFLSRKWAHGADRSPVSAGGSACRCPAVGGPPLSRPRARRLRCLVVGRVAWSQLVGGTPGSVRWSELQSVPSARTDSSGPSAQMPVSMRSPAVAFCSRSRVCVGVCGGLFCGLKTGSPVRPSAARCCCAW